MATISSKTKKTPNDYPKLSFRVDAETKEEILNWVNDIFYLFRDKKPSSQYVRRKNEIIVDALRLGLKEMEKKAKELKGTRKKELSIDEWSKRNKRNKPKGALF